MRSLFSSGANLLALFPIHTPPPPLMLSLREMNFCSSGFKLKVRSWKKIEFWGSGEAFNSHVGRGCGVVELHDMFMS